MPPRDRNVPAVIRLRFYRLPILARALHPPSLATGYLAVDMGPGRQGKRFMPEFTDDFRRGRDFNPSRPDRAEDRATDDDDIGDHLADHLGIISDGERAAGHVALDDTIDLDFAIGPEIADNVQTPADDRRHIEIAVTTGVRNALRTVTF